MNVAPGNLFLQDFLGLNLRQCKNAITVTKWLNGYQLIITESLYNHNKADKTIHILQININGTSNKHGWKQL